MIACFQSIDNFLFVGGELRRIFHFGHLGLFAQEGPAKLESDVVSVTDEEGAVGGDEVVGAVGVGVGETSGDSKDLALVAGGDGGGDKCPTLLGGFYDNGGIGECGDDAVAGWEIARVDGCARRVFCDKGTAGFEDAFGQRAILCWVNLVESMTEDSDGGEPMVKGGGVGSGIDTVGQSADYRCVVRLELANETVGVIASIGGSTAGADDGNGAFGIEVGRAEYIEQRWTVVGLGTVEPGGIIIGGKEEGANMVLFAEVELIFCTGETAFVQDVLNDAFMCSKGFFEFRLRQGENVLVGVEVDETADGGVAESRGEGEGYLRKRGHDS